MGLIVVVDINGQRLETSLTLAHLLEVAGVRKVLISGARGALDGWITRLKRHWESMEGIEVVQTAGRSDEATVVLAAHAISLCLSEPDTKGCQWLIISRREGFQALAEQLQRLGVKDARWAAALSQDVIRTLLDSESGVSGAIRDVAERMMARNPTRPLLIGALANTLTELIPELHSVEKREELFGSRKFKAICIAAGLKVKGDYVYPSGPPR
jgi:hypothetical protein